MPRRKAVHVGADFFWDVRRVAVNQVRRAEGDVIGKDDASAGGFNRLLFGNDSSGDIFRRLAVIRPFDVKIRFQDRDQFDRAGPVIDRHKVDAFQAGECFRAQTFRERRTARALVNETIGCDGDNKDIAEFARAF